MKPTLMDIMDNDKFMNNNYTQEEAQLFMDVFVSEEGKKPPQNIEQVIYDVIGGREGWKRRQKYIKKIKKEILKKYPKMKPYKMRTDLPDDPEAE